MKTKIDRLERDMDKVEKSFVSFDVFKATVKPLQDEIHDMRRDIKKILSAVSNKGIHEINS